jgi:hypothetical protein
MKRHTLQKSTHASGWEPMLRAKPVRNRAAEVDREHTQQLRLTVKRKPHPLLVPPISWFIRPRTSKTLILDPLGESVWELCDGVRDVESIIDIFADRHELTFHEARVAVTDYVRSLVQRGALAIAINERPEIPVQVVL